MYFNNTELYNIEALITTETENEYSMCRIPPVLRGSMNANAQKRAISPAGGEIRFNLLGEEAKIILRYKEDRQAEAAGMPVIAEIYQGCFQMSWQTISESNTEIVIAKPKNMDQLRYITNAEKLPFDADLTRLILPYLPEIRLIDIQGEVSLPKPDQVPSLKYLAYGSSITNGAFSVAPTATYAMKTATSLGVDLVNLGFGGGACMEQEMADYISMRRDWDFASLELGINCLYMEEEEFEKKVKYFVGKITEEHPKKWIFCIDLFTVGQDYGNHLNTERNFRKIVKKIVEDLHSPRVVHVDGRALLNKVLGLSADLVHPSMHGFDEIASNLVRTIRSKIDFT